MVVDLSRKSLESLVMGSSPDYTHFKHPLVVKAGHSYSDQYGRTEWDKLSSLTDEELYQLHLVCINSRK